jgi:peptide/nickel transport system substrate-binding protein
MVLFLMACCGQSTAADSSRLTKDTLIWAQTADIYSLDPQIGRQLVAVNVTGQIFDTLVKFSPTREIIPSVAESWKFLSDTELEMQIRKDIKFHNGDDLTAEDVVFTINRALNSPIVAYFIDFIDTVKTTGDYTVLITSKEPYCAFLNALTTPPTGIVPRRIAGSTKEPGFARHPIGSGPYKFVEWKPGESATLEAFEGHYLGTPPTKKLIMKVIPENAQQAIMLETGEIDVAYGIHINDVRKIEDHPDLKTIRELSPRSVDFVFNNKSTGPVSNKLVRQAIEYAIDKKIIVDRVLNGIGLAGNQFLAPGVFGHDATLPPSEFNVQKAKDLLAQAGYPNGFDMRLWVQNDQVYHEVCQVIQSQLHEVGINVKIEVLEYTTLLSMLYGGDDFDAILKFLMPVEGDGNVIAYSYYSTNPNNQTRFSSPETDDLIDRIRSTLDPDKRMELYRQFNAILRDEVPQFSVFYEEMVIAMSKNVERLEVQKEGYHKYRNVVVYAD